ncbi:MAG: ABC transporter ATP-binding protein [Acetobacteraceae bacterium]|nr:ABC transporter ATP-binding protein [Acetobacteraceae bacterium]
MLLDVQDLRVARRAPGPDANSDTASGPARGIGTALAGVSFRVVKGRILALVGEHGAGKSLTASAVLGLLQPSARVTGGRALFEGQDLLRMSDADLTRVRGARIGFVVQAGHTTLDPSARVGAQLMRAQSVHRAIVKAEAAWRAETLMSSMGIAEPRLRADAWPHELTPATVQRVVLALALINEPQLLIADEPTAGLDITTQVQILDLLYLELRRRRIGGIIITRDLGVVAQYCDDVAVMFAGQVVEQGPVSQVFARPAHPFTRALLATVPERLAIAGNLAFGGALPPAPDGCPYRPRCPEATERCTTAPPLVGAGVHAARCHFARLGAA